MDVFDGVLLEDVLLRDRANDGSQDRGVSVGKRDVSPGQLRVTPNAQQVNFVHGITA